MKRESKEGKIPDVYVTVGPADLIVTEVQPQFERVSGLDFECVKNTSANTFWMPTLAITTSLSRWFRSKSLERGSWEFVDGKQLQQDFSKIPEGSQKAGFCSKEQDLPKKR